MACYRTLTVSNISAYRSKYVLLNTDEESKFPLTTEHLGFQFKWELNYRCIDLISTTCEFKIEVKAINPTKYKKFLGKIDIDLEIWNTTKTQHSITFDFRSSLTHKETLLMKGNNAVTMTIKGYTNNNYSLVENNNELVGDQKNNKNEFITLIVQDEVIPAHRDILSQESQVFARMFDTDMLEKNSNTVKISDVEPNVFKELLSHVYFLKIYTQDLDERVKIFLAADKYSCENCKSQCSSFLGYRLTVDNVVDFLMLADRTQTLRLKSRCVNFIVLNADKVRGTQSYVDLIKSDRADLMADIFHSASSRLISLQNRNSSLESKEESDSD